MARNKEQQRIASSLWAKAHPERIRATRRRYQEKNKARIYEMRKKERFEKSAQMKAALKKWILENPEMVRMQAVRGRLRWMQRTKNNALQYHYNLTLAQYQEVEAIQGSGCAICGTTTSVGRSKRLHVDHDHASGLVRGLLCQRCNSAIGYLHDNAELVRRAAVYLEAFHAEDGSSEWPDRVRRVINRLPVILAGIPAASRTQGCAESVEPIEA